MIDSPDTLTWIEKVLEFLQCPECRQGRLTCEQPDAVLRCEHCGKGYPVHHGILDLLREQDQPLAEKAFGKRYARAYDRFYARRTFRNLNQSRFDNEFIEYTSGVQWQPAEVVVDVGCGTGNYTLQFAGQLSDGIAIGVDLSIAMLELLTQHTQNLGVENIIAIRANAEHLPFQNGSLGKVFNGCLHHLAPNIQPSLAEAQRCLGQGGVFFGKTIFAAKPVLLKMIQRMGTRALSARPIIPSVLMRELESVGFRNISIHPGGRDQFFFGYYHANK